MNEALFWWNDGTQHNVYEGTNMVEQSRVKFLGEAKINKDWSAGYSARNRHPRPPFERVESDDERIGEFQPDQQR